MRDRVTFLLNGERVDLDGIKPTTTLLAWLREVRRLTGSKEGCGEGDCGACTVVVGALVDGVVRYTAVNACIAFVPMLEGRHVLTVESLQGPDGALHPGQQAMVECHGSQCGFCTPGFVMSLYALYLNGTPTRAPINDALGGNLCRCTGYGPIVAAAERMLAMPRPAWDTARRERDAALLGTLQHGETVRCQDGHRVMYAPATLDALCDLAAAHPDATLVSGATDVGLWVTKQGRDLPQLIYTGRVPDAAFRAVTFAAGRVAIGGGVTHAQAMAALAHPAWMELWRRFAGPQVRSVGTVGGNLANGSPIGDLAPGLIALDARIRLRHGSSERAVPLEDFFIAYGRQDRRPGEVVVGVDLREPDADFTVHKVSKRFDDDISAVCGAFDIRVERGRIAVVRIAFGGMADIAKRAKAVEAALIGQPWTRVSIDAALPAFAVDFQPISDMRASAEYRLAVAKNLLVRTFIERTTPDVETRLVGADAAFGA